MFTSTAFTLRFLLTHSLSVNENHAENLWSSYRWLKDCGVQQWAHSKNYFSNQKCQHVWYNCYNMPAQFRTLCSWFSHLISASWRLSQFLKWILEEIKRERMVVRGALSEDAQVYPLLKSFGRHAMHTTLVNPLRSMTAPYYLISNLSRSNVWPNSLPLLFWVASCYSNYIP